MFKNFILSVLFLTFVLEIKAQTHIHENDFCGHRFEVEKIIKEQPDYLQWQDALFKQAMEQYEEIKSSKRKIISDTEYYEIKVVFHVLYNNTTENINRSYIDNQMIILNEAFRKRSRDTQRIRNVFKDIAADTRIQFVLADKDPEGNSTDGITRTLTNKTTFAINVNGQYNTDMKFTSRGGKNAWPTNKYMNVWVCNMRFPNQIAMTLGFATPPRNAPNWGGTGVTKDTLDPETGVVCHFSAIGSYHPQAINANLEGKTLVHEVGHFLGLRHTWGDGSTNQGCNVDDGIKDTPNSRTRNYSCNNNPNTCIDPVNDKPDMTENYMDYALDGCSAMFTTEQAFMMRYVLNILRTGLPSRKITFDTIPDNRIVKIYPNPSANDKNSTLFIQSPDRESFVIKMIDMSGKQVLEFELESNTITPLPTSTLANGLYFITIKEKYSSNIIDKRKHLVY
jgi:hypothetical protein